MINGWNQVCLISFVNLKAAIEKKFFLSLSIIDSLNISETDSYRDAFIKSFNPYLGKTVGEIAEIANISVPSAKSATATVVGIMVGFKRLNSKIKEFKQLGIKIKTVPIRTEDKSLFEAISFPSFVIKEFTQEEWDDSTFLSYLNKIIFVPFSREKRKEAVKNRVLEKPFFWTPTPSQLELIKTEDDELRKIYGVYGTMMESDNITGGPFISYFFDIPETNKVLIASGFVNFPGKDKVFHIKELEYMLETAKIIKQ